MSEKIENLLNENRKFKPSNKLSSSANATNDWFEQAKQDRLELKERMRALDYWNQLTYEKLLDHRLITKKELLQKLRSK